MTKILRPLKNVHFFPFKFRNFSNFSLVFLATLLYILSVNLNCNYDQPELCINWLFNERGLLYILISGVSSTLLFLVVWIRLICFWKSPSRYINMIWLLLTIYLLLQLERGENFYHHGTLNGIVLVAVLFLWLFVFSMKKLLTSSFSLFSKKLGVKKFSAKRKLLSIVFSQLLVCLMFFIFLARRNSLATKEFWDVPNFKIEPKRLSESTCNFRSPKFHSFDIISGFLNFARFHNCLGNDISWIPESLRNAKLIAFPKFNIADMKTATSSKELMRFTMQNLAEIRKGDSKFHETVLDIRGPSLEVKVVRNETLVTKQKILTQEQNLNVSSMNNILILFLDALSRRQMKRKLPETFRFLKNLHSQQKAPNDSMGKMEVRSYLKFHSIKPFTPPNIFPLLYGKGEDNFRLKIKKKKTDQSLFETLPGYGYVTGYGVTACQVTDFDWGPYQKVPLIRQDHRLAFCDPNVFDADEPYSNFKGPFSIFKRCLYSRYLHEYAFDYIKSFWSQYLDLPKFFMLHFSEGHEGTAEVVQYMDQHLKDFLNYSTINFINTSIFLVSDHGNHMNFILRQSDAEAYRAEVTAPLLNIIGNHDVMDENLSATNHNAYALVSMYDVHKTISQLVLRGIKKSTRSATRSTGAEDVFGRRTSRGYDLLRQQVSFKRSCSKAGISSKQCHC